MGINFRVILAFIFLFAFHAAHASSKKYRILIDPGHGGIDSGATQNGVREADLVLAIAQKLKSRLLASTQFEILMTRSGDETLGLEHRAKVADKLQPDLFISLHVNSSITPQAQGPEFFILGQMAEDEESMFLAHQENQIPQTNFGDEDARRGPSDVPSIVSDLKRTINIRHSLQFAKLVKQNWHHDINSAHGKIRQAPFHVLSHVSAPSILVELGYISHPKEGPWLASPEAQEQIAKTLARGIETYFGQFMKLQ